MRIEYEQNRQRYRRRSYSARRGAARYAVPPASVAPATQRFVQVVEVPERARNLHFYPAIRDLPPRYRSALQRIR